ncbi:MAG: hypothetical protein AAFN68_12495, partial [Pseudomonadota bacterium]
MRIVNIVLMLMISAAAIADDIEIYRGTADRVNPNVLFIMDTSGSMAWDASGNGTAGKDDPDSRMYQVREVAKDVVASTSGINIGLMRFKG